MKLSIFQLINQPTNRKWCFQWLLSSAKSASAVQVQSTDSQGVPSKNSEGFFWLWLVACSALCVSLIDAVLKASSINRKFEPVRWNGKSGWFLMSGRAWLLAGTLTAVRRPGQVCINNRLLFVAFWHVRQFKRDDADNLLQSSFNLEGHYATWYYVRLRILSQIEDRGSRITTYFWISTSHFEGFSISITKLKVQNWKLIQMENTEFEHYNWKYKLKFWVTRWQQAVSSWIIWKLKVYHHHPNLLLFLLLDIRICSARRRPLKNE